MNREELRIHTQSVNKRYGKASTEFKILYLIKLHDTLRSRTKCESEWVKCVILLRDMIEEYEVIRDKEIENETK